MAKPPPMGHNGGFYFESRDDLPPDLPKIHFFKLFMQDFLDDLLRLPMEERGFYTTAIFTMYKEMQGLPADDKLASMSMMIDVRQYRRLKEKVLERKLLHLTSTGRLSNKRFEAEICSYVTEFKNRREAAIDREQRRRKPNANNQQRDRDTSGTLPPEVSAKSGRSPADLREISRGSSSELRGDFSKNHNKNNEGGSTTEPQADHKAAVRARDLELESELEVEKKTYKPTNIASLDERAGVGENEASVDPKTIGAIRRLKELIYDDDEAHRIIESRLNEFMPEDWRDGMEDLARNRRNGTERRLITEDVVIAYVRQAERSRVQATAPPPSVEKPPPRTVEPGIVCDGIEIAVDKSIQLSNGVRQKWLGDFGGDERLLDLTLTEAAGSLRANDRASYEHQIKSALARAAKDIIIRKQNTIVATDRRAERAARPTSVDGVAKVETRAERLARMVAEMPEEGKTR